MTEPRIILLNDPTRGIDVGTKQELYRLMRELADQGAAILFYSTDYDELIGCCDRVAIMYDGRIVRELAGDELNETNIVASSLNIDAVATSSGGERPGREPPMSSDLAIRIRQNFAFLTAVVSLLRRLSSLPRGSSEGLLVGGARSEQRRGIHARAGGHGADRACSRRGPRPLGRRADDDGRLFRQLPLERRAGRDCPLSRLRRMAPRPRDAARRRARHPASASSSASRSAPSPGSSTASSSSMAGSSRLSRRWRRARSSSAWRCSCGRSPAARSTTI